MCQYARLPGLLSRDGGAVPCLFARAVSQKVPVPLVEGLDQRTTAGIS